MPTALTNIATVFSDLLYYLVAFLACALVVIAANAFWVWRSFRSYRAALSAMERECLQRQEDRLQEIAAEPEPEPLADFAK